MPELPVIVLTGPTAVGKTSLSIQLAQALHTEIISSDSRQIYREMTIGTAKPSPEELASVRHHLIDERHLPEPYSAGIFANEATRLIEALHRKGKIPLVVGGSTLYLHALLYGLSDIPSIDRSVRAALQQRLMTEGLEALYHELMLLDPQTALALDPHNSQRIVRALEVYHGTGRPLSSFHTTPAKQHRYSFYTYVLFRDREGLYERINRRVDKMMENGLEHEVKAIISSGIDPDTIVLKTIGYKEVVSRLRDRISQTEMLRLIKRNTRRYAKRQLTWFRRYPSFNWVDADESIDFIVNDITRIIR